MFERYTEAARRTIFFARYEASQFGSSRIESEHLLLGLLREDKALVNRFLHSHGAVESIRRQIGENSPIRAMVATSVDLPLSHECKRVLAYGAEESERLNHKHLGTEHLLLGLFREEKCFAAQLLREQGVSLELVRERVQPSGLASARRRSVSTTGLSQWFANREAEGKWTIEKRDAATNTIGSGTTHFALYAAELKETDGPQPQAAVVCIAAIGDDLFPELRQRCEDYITEGVAEVWLLDPGFRRVYTVTKADGLREFKGEILQIKEPLLEMDLRKIFD